MWGSQLKPLKVGGGCPKEITGVRDFGRARVNIRCRWGVHVGLKKKKNMRMTSVRDVGRHIKVCMLVCK